MNLKSTYNRIAKDWFKEHKEDTWWIEGINRFISFLRPNALVLDVGCGAGLKSKYIIEKRLQIVGIDFSREMIEIAKQKVKKGEFYVMDLKDIMKLPQLFDGILVHQVLIHFPKKEIKNILQIIISKLRQKGYLYIVVKEKKTESKEEEIITENDYGYKYSRFFSYFNLDELENHLTDVGMVVCWKNRAFSGKNQIQIIAQKL